VGITNGCIDALAQGSAYPEFAFNNTYGIQAIPQDIYEAAKLNFTKPGGCVDLINACRDAAAVGDPLEYGSNATVNQICVEATEYCFGVVQGAYTTYSNVSFEKHLAAASLDERTNSLLYQRTAFDIAHFLPDVFPPEYSYAFYNQPWVQNDLGVPLNFTLTSNLIVEQFFEGTGDPMRRTMGDLEYLLSAGLNVALVYGDRDYRCNCKCIPMLTRTY
jgi:Serine carboxypeptidase